MATTTAEQERLITLQIKAVAGPPGGGGAPRGGPLRRVELHEGEAVLVDEGLVVHLERGGGHCVLAESVELNHERDALLPGRGGCRRGVRPPETALGGNG